MSQTMSRSRGWCFTINNYTDEDYQNAKELCNYGDYGIIGIECGKEGTPHLQGYVYDKKRIYFNIIKEMLPRAHLEQARGSPKQNIEYCSKENNFTEYGEKPQQRKRDDIEEFRDAIFANYTTRELLMEFPMEMAKYNKFYELCKQSMLEEEAEKIDNPIITTIIGEPGIGKTKYVYDHHERKDIYKLECGDGSSNSLFWNGYNGQSVILIDDFHNNIKLDYMLRLLDRYPMQLSTKGSYTWKCAKYIYITSNIPVNEWYPYCPTIHRKALKRRITNQLVLQDQRT